MRNLIYVLLFLPFCGIGQTVSVAYEMNLRAGKKAAVLPASLTLQLNNIVADYRYRYSRNKSEYIFEGQRAKDPKIPKVNINMILNTNTHKDLMSNEVYRDNNSMPGVVSRGPLPEWDWKIDPDTVTVILEHTCRKATATDVTGRSLTVWYALDLAIPDGPDDYCGLRGLILQVESDDFTLKATRIDIDPENEAQIDMPQAEKYLTAEEFNQRKSGH